MGKTKTKSKKDGARAVLKPGTIDPRTEQILREALAPSTVGSAQPAAAAAAPSDPPPAAETPAAQTPLPDTPLPEAAPLRPAARSRSPRRRGKTPAPVSVTDPHFHQDQSATPASEGESVPEDPAAAGSVDSGAYDRLRQLMGDLPVKAGTAKIEINLGDVALATLHYYQYGLSEPEGEALPVGVTSGAQSSASEDIAIIAGYLDLEKRFGRVDSALDSNRAARHLMAALASRALSPAGQGSGNEAFVREAVDGCLQPGEPSQATPPTSPDDGSSGGGAARLVYRRKSEQ